jgi:hypothetical protein
MVWIESVFKWAVCLLAVSASQAVMGKDRLSDPVSAFARQVGNQSTLLKIERDYNNDGTLDVALAQAESCGNKTCAFELYLRQRSGRFVHVGVLGGLTHGYRLRPLTSGVSIWETCVTSGEQTHQTSLMIDQRGLSEPKVRLLLPSRADVTCKPQVSYEWAECDLRQVSAASQCKWVPKYWTP